jgi:lipid-A-disaccharide synthase-like uncharacterized protein
LSAPLAFFTSDELLNPLVLFGFAAQILFMMRFLVQWIVSERRGRSTIPNAFWYLSLLGGVLLCVYAILKRDPVFTLGQTLGVFIYLRNIILIQRRSARLRRQVNARAAAAASSPSTKPTSDADQLVASAFDA